MAASLTVTPNPSATGSRPRVDGSGFAKYRTRLLLDGVVVTQSFRPDPNGTFHVGIDVAQVAGTQSLVAQQFSAKAWRPVTSVSITVTASTPTPTPTPDPTPAPDPTPTPTPTPTFLGRPQRANVVINGGTDVELSDFTVRGGGVNSPSGIGITLINVTRAWIHHVDGADLVGFIYVRDCTDVVVEDCRGRNIGDGTIGSGHSNFVQFAETRGGAIRRNKFLGGRSEDMISTWHSGGWATGKELLIEDNQLQGLVTDTSVARSYTSSSGTGIIISDGAGSPKNGNVIVRRNRLLTPGQVGIQHIDGTNIQTYENIIYGENHPKSNNPMTSWEGQPYAEVHHNRYYWLRNGQTVSPWWYGGGTINAHDNFQDSTIKPSEMQVSL